MLRYLLDPDSMTVNVERNEFLDVFYDKYISALVKVLTETPDRYVIASISTPSLSSSYRACQAELHCGRSLLSCHLKHLAVLSLYCICN